jgi:hypothetical protein
LINNYDNYDRGHGRDHVHDHHHGVRGADGIQPNSLIQLLQLLMQRSAMQIISKFAFSW